MVLAYAFVRLNRPCTRDSFRTSLFALRACIKTAVFTSDKIVLCKPSGLKSLGFFDTLDPPPKTPGNTGLQAGQLAVYPRACGGTFPRSSQRILGNGLSPRVRGNQVFPEL